MMNTDPDRPVNDILDEISKACFANARTELKMGLMIAPFSALLVKLSKDAETTAASVNSKTQTLIKLTRVLIVLTIALIILTIPIVWIEIFGKHSEGVLHLPQNNNYGGQDENYS
jgi:hypothetical protein